MSNAKAHIRSRVSALQRGNPIYSTKLYHTKITKVQMLQHPYIYEEKHE